MAQPLHVGMAPDYAALRARWERLAGYSPASFGRTDLGESSLSEFIAQFQHLQRLFAYLRDTTPDLIPVDRVVGFRTCTAKADQLLVLSERYARSMAGGDAQRTDIAEQLVETYKDTFNAVAEVASFARVSSFESGRENLDAKYADIRQLADKLERRLAERAVADESDRFAQQAAGHATEAKQWLKFTTGLGVSVVVLSVAAFALARYDASAGLSAGAALQVTIAKVVVLSIFATAALWSARVYKANRHNAVVNEHRANALACFRDFSTATDSDADVKRAVLLQATQCIFTPQHTGFIADEPDNVVPSIVDLARSAKS